MKTKTSPKGKHCEDIGTVWKVLVGVCVASVLWLALLVSVMSQVNEATESSFMDGYSAGVDDASQLVVEDQKTSYMPMHLQIDPQWSNIDYSTGTIESHGCGLCCLSMMVSYLEGREVYPSSLVTCQDSFLQADVNDQDAMCKWASDTYGFQWSGEQWGFEDSIDELLDEGYIVMCGMEGKLGDSEYDGHVVLVYGKTEDGYLIRDPDSAENSVHVFTDEELSDVTWSSLNGLKV